MLGRATPHRARGPLSPPGPGPGSQRASHPVQSHDLGRHQAREWATEPPREQHGAPRRPPSSSSSNQQAPSPPTPPPASSAFSLPSRPPDLGLVLGLTGWPALTAWDAAVRLGDPAAILTATAALSAALAADAAAPTRAAAALTAGRPGLRRARVPSVADRAATAADPAPALEGVLRRDRRDVRAVKAILRAGQVEGGEGEGDDGGSASAAAAAAARDALAFAAFLPRGERTRRILLSACSSVGNMAQTIAVVAGCGDLGGGASDDEGEGEGEGEGEASPRPDLSPAVDGAAALLRVAGRSGDAASVSSAFDAALAFGVAGNTAVMNAAVGAWVAVGDGDAATAAYVACRRRGAAPDTTTLNALVRAARAAGRLDRVRRLWDRALRAPGPATGSLPRPDRHTRAAVLAAAGAAVEEAAAAAAGATAADGTATASTLPPATTRPPSAAWLLSVYADGALVARLPPCPLGVAALAFAMRGAAGRTPEHVSAVFAAAAELRAAAGRRPWARASSDDEVQDRDGDASSPPSSSPYPPTRPDQWMYAELLQLAAASGEADRAVPLFAAATGDEARLGDPDPHLYSALAKCVASGGTPELLNLGDAARRALAAQWRLADRRAGSRVVSAEAAVQVAARAADGGGGGAPPTALLLKARAVLEDAKAASAASEHDHRVAHNALLHALASCGRASSAKALFTGMLTHGPSPDVISFNAVIDAAAQAGDADAAFDLYAGMLALGRAEAAAGAEAGIHPPPPPTIRPDVETFGALMHACARRARAADAEAVLTAARAAGVAPTVQLYTSLAAAAVAAGDTDRAFAAVDELRADGLAPTGPTYGVLLAACELRGDVDKALSLYRAAIADGVRPTDEAHNALMSVCGAAGRFDDALDCVKSLLSGDLAPSADPALRTDALNSAARALAGAGFVDRAVRVTALLRAAVGPGAPTPDTLSAVLGAAARGGRVAIAEDLYAALAARGALPSREAASDLIIALCGAGRLKDALAVYTLLLRGEASLLGSGGGGGGGDGGAAGSEEDGASAAAGPGAAAALDSAIVPPPAVLAAVFGAAAVPGARPAHPPPSLAWWATGGGGGGGGGGWSGALARPPPPSTTTTTPRVRVRAAASIRTRRAAGAVAAAPALAALVAALAGAGDLDGALHLYASLRRRGLGGGSGGGAASHSLASARLAYPPAGCDRAWEALIEAACRAGRPGDALPALDDWRAAADAAAAASTSRPGRPIPTLSPAVLAYLEASLRRGAGGGGGGRGGGGGGEGGAQWRVLDVRAAMRTRPPAWRRRRAGRGPPRPATTCGPCLAGWRMRARAGAEGWARLRRLRRPPPRPPRSAPPPPRRPPAAPSCSARPARAAAGCTPAGRRPRRRRPGRPCARAWPPGRRPRAMASVRRAWCGRRGGRARRAARVESREREVVALCAQEPPTLGLLHQQPTRCCTTGHKARYEAGRRLLRPRQRVVAIQRDRGRGRPDRGRQAGRRRGRVVAGRGVLLADGGQHQHARDGRQGAGQAVGQLVPRQVGAEHVVIAAVARQAEPAGRGQRGAVPLVAGANERAWVAARHGRGRGRQAGRRPLLARQPLPVGDGGLQDDGLQPGPARRGGGGGGGGAAAAAAAAACCMGPGVPHRALAARGVAKQGQARRAARRAQVVGQQGQVGRVAVQAGRAPAGVGGPEERGHQPPAGRGGRGRERGEVRRREEAVRQAADGDDDAGAGGGGRRLEGDVRGGRAVLEEGALPRGERGHGVLNECGE